MTKEVIIKHKKTKRYKCAQLEMQKAIKQIISNYKLYNMSLNNLKNSLMNNIDLTKYCDKYNNKT